jgi:acyl-CoA dehydrogenase
MADRSFLDWPFLDDRHRRLADALEVWCAKEFGHGPHPEATDEVDAACRDLLRRLGAGGWLRWCVPASHGGISEALDVRALSLIRETLARHDGLADFVFAMQGLGSGTVTLFGSPAQQGVVLPEVAAGTRCAAFALTEPDAGSDAAAMTTSARRTPSGWRIDGAKTYISNGGIADHYVLFARTGEAPGARGISAFLVPADTPGLTVAARLRAVAPHPLAELRFDAMELPVDALIGDAGRGFAQAMATLDIFRTTVGAAALGFARRALDEATARVRTRRLQGALLADNAVVQAQLADMALMIDRAALLIYRAGWVRDVMGRRNTREAAMAKLEATESAQAVVDMAVQLHGGLGVTHGHIVESLYREVRALRIYEGASEVQRIVIARAHLAEAAGGDVPVSPAAVQRMPAAVR